MREMLLCFVIMDDCTTIVVQTFIHAEAALKPVQALGELELDDGSAHLQADTAGLGDRHRPLQKKQCAELGAMILDGQVSLWRAIFPHRRFFYDFEAGVVP